ncbi:MAG: MBL fold metallo-hydrolase [Calditrichia bacterium]
MKSFTVEFWGVRGSIPTPGQSTLRYGGNTACVEINFSNGQHFIMDAGTGIRELGKKLLKTGKPVESHIFISHFHWDHIQGLPFFRPAFRAGNKFTILGSDDAQMNLDQLISFQMDPTYFPVAIEDMQANIQFQSIKEGTLQINEVEVDCIYLNHPGYALGFRINYQGHSLVYISDNEPFFYHRPGHIQTRRNNSPNLEELFDNFVENRDEYLIRFCKGSDLLIHDTQFFPDEYHNKVTWGHSPFSYTVDLAIRSQVKQLALFHHDPDHDDEVIDQMEQLSCELIEERGATIQCVAAREGMILEI